jgi:hypothetical protein
VGVVKVGDLSSSEDSSDSDSDSDSSDSDEEPEPAPKPKKSTAKEPKPAKKVVKAPEPAQAKQKIKDVDSDRSNSSDEDSDDSDDSDEEDAEDKKVKVQKKTSDETKKANSTTNADAIPRFTGTPQKSKGKKGKKPKIERTVGKNALKRLLTQALRESTEDKAAFDAMIQKSHRNLTPFETNSLEKSWNRKLQKRLLERKLAFRRRNTGGNNKAVEKAAKFAAKKEKRQAKFEEKQRKVNEKMTEQGLTPGDEQQQKRLAEMAKRGNSGSFQR